MIKKYNKLESIFKYYFNKRHQLKEDIDYKDKYNKLYKEFNKYKKDKVNDLNIKYERIKTAYTNLVKGRHELNLKIKSKKNQTIYYREKYNKLLKEFNKNETII